MKTQRTLCICSRRSAISYASSLKILGWVLHGPPSDLLICSKPHPSDILIQRSSSDLTPWELGTGSCPTFSVVKKQSRLQCLCNVLTSFILLLPNSLTTFSQVSWFSFFYFFCTPWSLHTYFLYLLLPVFFARDCLFLFVVLCKTFSEASLALQTF